MSGRKAEKSEDFLKIRDAEGRIVTEPRFLEISLCASTRGFAFAARRSIGVAPSTPHKNNKANRAVEGASPYGQAQRTRIFAEREYLSLRYERKFLVPFFIGVLRAE